MRHVLDGDDSGGGHRHGTGIAGKTEFPARWGDGLARAYVLDVARHPDVIEKHQNNGRWRVNGQRDGVIVVAIVEPSGMVVTGWPKPGGDGVVKNPEEGE